MGKLTKAGVTWLDVEEALLALQADTQGQFAVTIRTGGVGLYRKKGLSVGLVGVWARLAGREGCSREYWETWPQYGHRTMTGLIVRMVHEANEDFLRRPLTYHKQGKLGLYLPG